MKTIYEIIKEKQITDTEIEQKVMEILSNLEENGYDINSFENFANIFSMRIIMDNPIETKCLLDNILKQINNAQYNAKQIGKTIENASNLFKFEMDHERIVKRLNKKWIDDSVVFDMTNTMICLLSDKKYENAVNNIDLVHMLYIELINQYNDYYANDLDLEEMHKINEYILISLDLVDFSKDYSKEGISYNPYLDQLFDSLPYFYYKEIIDDFMNKKYPTTLATLVNNSKNFEAIGPIKETKNFDHSEKYSEAFKTVEMLENKEEMTADIAQKVSEIITSPVLGSKEYTLDKYMQFTALIKQIVNSGKIEFVTREINNLYSIFVDEKCADISKYERAVHALLECPMICEKFIVNKNSFNYSDEDYANIIQLIQPVDISMCDVYEEMMDFFGKGEVSENKELVKQKIEEFSKELPKAEVKSAETPKSILKRIGE